MDIEKVRQYCLSLPGSSEGMPFGDTVLVFKVMGKMFALMGLEGDLSINLKCDPELAIQLREEFEFVKPGYHMNKQHWNTITGHPELSSGQLKEWIDQSYELVAAGLSRKDKEALKALRDEK